VNEALKHAKGKDLKFIVMGERGAELLKDAGFKCEAFPAVPTDIRSDDAVKLAGHVIGMYKRSEIRSFNIVYMRFKSFTSHHIETARVLPCDELLGYVGTSKDLDQVVIEPSEPLVIEYLVKLWTTNSIYNVFWSSKLSEWAVRVMRLESSSDELKKVVEKLRFDYFKGVHAQSDKVIREIFAAKAAK
jgi:F0F1-type ATP synthase gamma subunit